MNLTKEESILAQTREGRYELKKRWDKERGYIPTPTTQEQRDYSRKWYKVNKEKVRENTNYHARIISDSYICNRLLKLKQSEVPQELIELKRLTLQLKRELKS